jgi:hypothetical protein
MTEPDDTQTREEGVYAAVLGYLRQYASRIFFFMPLALLILLPTPDLWAALLAVAWPGEAIAYRLFTGRTWFPFPMSWRLVVVLAVVGSQAVSQVIALVEAS